MEAVDPTGLTNRVTETLLAESPILGAVCVVLLAIIFFLWRHIIKEQDRYRADVGALNTQLLEQSKAGFVVIESNKDALQTLSANVQTLTAVVQQIPIKASRS